MIEKIDNMIICGDPIDAAALTQLKECAKLSNYAIMCADHHKGYSVPIGAVMVSESTFSPAAVGFDIACGMKGVKLNLKLNQVKPNISEIMDNVVSRISFGIGRINNNHVEHQLFDSDLWKIPAASPHKEMARNQLGTVGAGNHFVSISSDENEDIWAWCHFGSRDLGHKIATWFLKESNAKDDIDSPPSILHEQSDLGQQYLQAIDLAGQYAYAGRDWVCAELSRILNADIIEEVHSHHNFLWREEHLGKKYWVGRKGATPCFPGQKGLVGASMGEPSVIIEGIDSTLSSELFYSTVHGAGRVMSRTQARGKMNRKTKEILSPGRVSQEMMTEWLTKADVELRGGDLDESPRCYKRLSEVLTHHQDTIKIVHTLTPIGVAMASKHTIDPFKD